MELKRHIKRDYLSIFMALQASVAQGVQFSGVYESCFVDIWQEGLPPQGMGLTQPVPTQVNTNTNEQER